MGNHDDDYRMHLVTRFRLQDASSSPSMVFANTRRIVMLKFKADTGEYAHEVKSMYKRGGDHHSANADTATLIAPLATYMGQLSFQKASLDDWENQIRALEVPKTGQLRPLLDALPSHPVRQEQKRGVRGAGVIHSVSESPSDLPSSQHGVETRVEQLSAQVASLAATLSRGSATSAGSTAVASLSSEFQQLAAQVNNLVRSQQPKLHPSMAANFVAAGTGVVVGGAPKFDPAFAVEHFAMDTKWVAAYGVVGFPAPNDKKKEYLQIQTIMDVCNVKCPPGFTNTKVVGGSTCPACVWVVQNQGHECPIVHPHPADPERANDPGGPPKRKPAGVQHVYAHQIMKCPRALAMAHRCVRLGIDAGRQEDIKHILNPAPMA